MFFHFGSVNKRRTFAIILVCTACFRSFAAEGSSDDYQFANVVYNLSDDPSFAEFQIDTSTWQQPEEGTFLFHKHKAEDIPKGVFWIRIGLLVSANTDTPKTLFEAVKGAREIYWDGIRIGSTGTVASTKELETPGLARQWISIPPELYTEGYHQLAFRVSSNHNSFTNEGFVDDLQIWDNRDTVKFIVGSFEINDVTLGFALVATLFFLMLFVFSERKLTHLAFALFCLGGFLSLLARYIWSRSLHTITYDEELSLIYLIWCGSVISSLFLALYFVSAFPCRRKTIWLVLSIIALSILMIARESMGEELEELIYLAGLLPAALLCIINLLKRSEGSLILSIGVTLFAGGFLIDADDFGQWGFFGLLGCVLARTGLQLRDQRIQKQRALMDVAELETKRAQLETMRIRAEAELLRKSIQPHFLINTLTALVEWVAEDPQKGIEMIQAIERHFDLLLSVTDKKLIPIGTELDLCDSFLTIMSFRKLVDYRLERVGIDESIEMPPLLFHTLVENGVTHNDYDTEQVVFRLNYETEGAKHRYIFNTPYSGKSNSRKRESEGTGLKYARLRLEESFPNNWVLNSSKGENEWTTIVEINR